MDESDLIQGFKELDALSTVEYHQSLEAIVSDPNTQQAADRVGRLIGVYLKEPFAVSIERSEPSIHSRAFREWQLVGSEEFHLRAATEIWQVQALESMRRESMNSNVGLYGFAVDAHYESGFFGRFSENIRKYICGDKAIRKKVDEAVRGASRSGNKLPQLTPEIIVASGGLALGAYLIQVVPLLGMVGAPVVAAVVLILYTLGVDAFCKSGASGAAAER